LGRPTFFNHLGLIYRRVVVDLTDEKVELAEVVIRIYGRDARAETT
jgi:hypothetical protein